MKYMPWVNLDTSRKFFVGSNEEGDDRAVRNRIYNQTGNEMGVRPNGRPLLERKKRGQLANPGLGTPPGPDNID
jgi:hypothetical protein